MNSICSMIWPEAQGSILGRIARSGRRIASVVTVGVVVRDLHRLELLEPGLLGDLVLALVGVVLEVADVGDVAHVAHLVARQPSGSGTAGRTSRPDGRGPDADRRRRWDRRRTCPTQGRTRAARSAPCGAVSVLYKESVDFMVRRDFDTRRKNYKLSRYVQTKMRIMPLFF